MKKRVISLFLCILMINSATLSISAAETEQSSIADQIVEVARAEVGYYGSGSNKFNEWYYGVPSTVDWCAVFISWCADRVGVLEKAIPRRASCLVMMNWFKTEGVYYDINSGYVPQKGDIVFFDTDGSGVPHHVEFISEDGYNVSEDGKTYIRSIGGNASNENFVGLDYVIERDRDVNHHIAVVMGFAHPEYEQEDNNTAKSFFDRLRDFFQRIIEFFRNLFS